MGTRTHHRVGRPSRLLIGVALAVVANGAGALATTAGATTTTVTLAPNPVTPGDIPDTVAYVTYANTAGRYQFKHPEGWAQSSHATSVLFTDSYNGVAVDVTNAAAAPSHHFVTTSVVAKLHASQSAFSLLSVAPVKLPAGAGYLVIYRRNSPPNAVTNKSVRQEVHLYVLYAHHRSVQLSLFGAVGADNVDPYAKMSQSLRIR